MTIYRSQGAFGSLPRKSPQNGHSLFLAYKRLMSRLRGRKRIDGDSVRSFFQADPGNRPFDRVAFLHRPLKIGVNRLDILAKIDKLRTKLTV